MVEDNKKVAPGHYVIRLRSRLIAPRARPGQFAQILCDAIGGGRDPLLPRPFSFLAADKETFSVLYQVVGKGTRLLSLLKKGQTLWATGPLGNGFSAAGGKECALALVGGGVGIPPLFHLAWELTRKEKLKASRVQVFLGARCKSLLLCEKEFKRLGVVLRVATDDGSKGHKGFVTELLGEFLSSFPATRGPRRVYACGPTPMLRTVSALCGRHAVEAEVSVEEPMACGFGACLGCAIKLRTPHSERPYRYAIACTEGPVFPAATILWD
ncbi:MAG: dihydroorotate dehydrogenase electron transfer subunit [Candidatus Omnitrophica bacterium]|nr:dihydroorotate dehydrogenase electron transfer subunit [Candidatus Omnitrophota bacterium]